MNLNHKPEIQLELPNMETGHYHYITKEKISFPWPRGITKNKTKSLKEFSKYNYKNHDLNMCFEFAKDQDVLNLEGLL
jgi:hypothetical protein